MLMKKLICTMVLLACATVGTLQAQDKKVERYMDFTLGMNFLSNMNGFDDFLATKNIDSKTGFMPQVGVSFASGWKIHDRLFLGFGIGWGIGSDGRFGNDEFKRKDEFSVFFDLGYRIYKGDILHVDFNTGFGYGMTGVYYSVKDDATGLYNRDYYVGNSAIVPLEVTLWFCNQGREVCGLSLGYNLAFAFDEQTKILGTDIKEDVEILPSTLGFKVKFRL